MLFESPYNFIEQADGYVRFVSLPVLYESPDEMFKEAVALQIAFPTDRRATLRCLRDLRAARGNNDPSFERVLRESRLRVFKGWERLAALMTTESGVLLCGRLFDSLDIVAHITVDQRAAIAHLVNDVARTQSARG